MYEEASSFFIIIYYLAEIIFLFHFLVFFCFFQRKMKITRWALKISFPVKILTSGRKQYYLDAVIPYTRNNRNLRSGYGGTALTRDTVFKSSLTLDFQAVCQTSRYYDIANRDIVVNRKVY